MTFFRILTDVMNISHQPSLKLLYDLFLRKVRITYWFSSIVSSQHPEYGLLFLIRILKKVYNFSECMWKIQFFIYFQNKSNLHATMLYFIQIGNFMKFGFFVKNPQICTFLKFFVGDLDTNMKNFDFFKIFITNVKLFNFFFTTNLINTQFYNVKRSKFHDFLIFFENLRNLRKNYYFFKFLKILIHI